MSNLRKYLEILFFIVVNLLFASNALAMLSIMIISNLLSLFLFDANPVYENDYPFVIFCLILGLVFLILKIMLFPVLYKYEKQFPYIHSFFNNIFKSNKNIILWFIALLILLILDAVIYLWISNETHFEQIYIESFGLGLIPSYLIMYLYIKLNKNKYSKR